MKNAGICAALALLSIGVGSNAARAQKPPAGSTLDANAASAAGTAGTALDAFSDSPETTGNTMFAHSLGAASEKARTLRVTEANFAVAKDGTLQLRSQYRIVFDGPAHSVRVDVDAIPAPPSQSPGTAAKIGEALPHPTLSFYNGKQTVVYDSTANQYLRLTKQMSPLSLPSYGIDLSTEIMWVRGFVVMDNNPVGEDAIDGRKMVVKEVETGKTPDTNHPTLRVRHYIDAETQLLRRTAYFHWVGNEWKVTRRSDYTNWILNAPVNPALFVWTPPIGAKEVNVPAALPANLEGRPSPLTAGTMAPDFTCIGADGKPLKLSDLRGKIVILDFWATWCGPCQRSMPHLERVYRATKGTDVTVLAVCVWDDRDAYDKWQPAHQSAYTFPLAFDPAGKDQAESIAASLFNVSGIPTQYVIDKAGKVAGSNVGYRGDTDHRLEAMLATLGVIVPLETKTASTK